MGNDVFDQSLWKAVWSYHAPKYKVTYFGSEERKMDRGASPELVTIAHQDKDVVCKYGDIVAIVFRLISMVADWMKNL